MIDPSLAADFVLYFHAALVTFLVGGEVLILAGGALKWRWVRRRILRFLHIGLMGFVALEAVGGIWCPLTILEEDLRNAAGRTGGHVPFMARLLRRIIFYDFPPWAFTVAYVAFFILILLTFLLVPPRERESPGRKER